MGVVIIGIELFVTLALFWLLMLVCCWNILMVRAFQVRRMTLLQICAVSLSVASAATGSWVLLSIHFWMLTDMLYL